MKKIQMKKQKHIRPVTHNWSNMTAGEEIRNVIQNQVGKIYTEEEADEVYGALTAELGK